MNIVQPSWANIIQVLPVYCMVLMCNVEIVHQTTTSTGRLPQIQQGGVKHALYRSNISVVVLQD